MRVWLFILGLVSYSAMAQGVDFLVDTSNFHQLTKRERVLLDTSLSNLTENNDTVYIREVYAMMMEMNDNDVWILYNNYILEQLESRNIESANPRYYQELKLECLVNEGYYNSVKGQDSLALAKYEHAAIEAEEFENYQVLGYSRSNIGIIQKKQGLIEQAIKNYQLALESFQSINYDRGIALVLNNLAVIYSGQDNSRKAIEYYSEAARLNDETGQLIEQGAAYNNIGKCYIDLASYDSARYFLNRSLVIQMSTGNKMALSYTYKTIGHLFLQLDQLDSAEYYFMSSVKLDSLLGNDEARSNALYQLGNIAFKRNDYERTKELANQAMETALTDHHAWNLLNAHKLLYHVKKENGLYEQALQHYETLIVLRDSINNEETQKATIRQQTQYEFEKAQLVKKQEEKEEARVFAEQTTRRNNLQHSLIFLGILLFFGVILGLGFVKVSPTVAEGLIFFAFLILFEFLLVLGDPFVESITDGEPIYKLLANAMLAGLIFPIHAFFERTLKKKLVK